MGLRSADNLATVTKVLTKVPAKTQKPVKETMG
jgi:hypothetical protein